MESSEYLKLARQKGWDVKIPLLEDGTYNCDVFGGDDVKFVFAFAISGTLFLKDNAVLERDVFAQDGIILGDGADTYGLVSDDGDVILGNYANTCRLAGKNVTCGDDLYTNKSYISATDGFVILGQNPPILKIDDNGKVSATEDIICDDEPTT